MHSSIYPLERSLCFPSVVVFLSFFSLNLLFVCLFGFLLLKAVGCM